MRLCRLHDGFNSAVGLSLSQVFLESVSEDGQLTIGLEATEGFLGLQQAGGGPSERHLGVPPTFDVAGDLTHRAERVLDDVGAGALSSSVLFWEFFGCATLPVLGEAS